MYDHVAAVVVNFQTPGLLCTAVESFRTFYPDTHLLIVDNGSQDDSRDVIESLVARSPRRTQPVYFDENVFHGPAMHRAIQIAEKAFVYVFDSDTKTQRGGFLEEMRGLFLADDRLYAAGKVDSVNKRGFRDERGMEIVLSPYMMIRRATYLRLPPFVHHGMPTLQNFEAAHNAGWTFRSYPIESYVDHKGRGTADKFGYGLGWRGKLEYLLNKLGM